MKRKMLLVLQLLSFLAFHVNAQLEPLSNAEIVKLSKLELPPAAIISKIKNSQTHFDISVDALVALKQQGVNAEIISEMIAAGAHEQKEVANQKDYNDPKTMRRPGVYYYNKSDPSNLFITIDPTVVSNSKSGGFGSHLAQQYSYGLAKNKHISELSGAHSRRQIPHAKPKFYFYFNPTESISPNEFSLVRLTERKHNREMIVGVSNGYGSESGISEKQTVDFTYEQVADGIYKVYAKEPMETGEYCFVYTGSAPTLFSNNKVYDFGISVPAQ